MGDSIDWAETARTVALSVAAKIPQVGGAVAFLLGKYWPSNAPTIWDQVSTQVQGLVDQGILAAEITDRQADIAGLRDTIRRYTHAGATEAGGILEVALGKADDIYEHLERSPNALHLIPLGVALAHLHLSLLVERQQHGTQIFPSTPYQPQWGAELTQQRQDYRTYFREKFALWYDWRSAQITADCWIDGVLHNVTNGKARDAVTGQEIQYSEGMNTNKETFRAAVNAARAMMFNRAVADMAGVMASTFLLNLYDPVSWNQSPDIFDDRLKFLVLGPYCGASMQQDGHGPTRVSTSDTKGFVRAVRLRAYNSIDGFQLRYIGRDGTDSGSPTGGAPFEVSVPLGAHFTGLDVAFNNQLMYEVTLHLSDGSTSGPYGNKGNWRGSTARASLEPSYALVGADYATGPGPSATMGTSVLQLQFAHASLMPAEIADGKMLRQPGGEISVIFGAARFHVPDVATLNRLYANIPTNAITDAFAQSIPLLPSDGTLLREDSGAIWVVYGGAGFHVPDPTTLTRLFDVAKVRQLWNGALTANGIGLVPRDKTQLREENGAIWIIYGGAGFHVPDPATLIRLYPGTKAGQLWNGAITQNGIGLIPRDGTLLREENGAIWVICGGAGLHVPDPATLTRLFDPTQVCQLWNGSLTQNGIGSIPRDGTLLREESSNDVYIMSRGHKTITTSFPPENVRVIWNGALSSIP